MEILIITGLSGAGKSTAINSLEDLGYFSIDNLPPTLIPPFIELSKNAKTPITKLALGVDIRMFEIYENIDAIEDSIHQFDLGDDAFQIVFLEASDEVLIKRYKETRRTHPLSKSHSLIDGINAERERMHAIKMRSNRIIDTSDMTGRQLSQHIKDIVLSDTEVQPISITFKSFGFKKGLPLDSDLVFDVRFLPNPYYDESLRHMTGNDAPIQNFVFKWRETKIFYSKLRQMLDFLLPQYIREGKSSVTICIGCTGGHHRSVSIANRLAEDYKGQHYITTVVHRDI